MSQTRQCIAEPEEELASLLDNDDGLNKFSNEVKRLNQESKERIMDRIIQNVKSNIMKRVEKTVNQVTDDNECFLKPITDDNESVIKRITIDNESVMKRITDDNEFVIKRISECIERNSRYTKQNQ